MTNSSTTDGITRKHVVIGSLLSGSLSSTLTTIIYQPLELLKTKIQLQEGKSNSSRKVIGRLTQSATRLAREQGISGLWRGTGASLLRSVPGVGLYYASLNILHSNLSLRNDRPDNPAQAFYFGLTARSMVSFILIPVTVIKVRYESGYYKYPSLATALRDAYLKNGWVGVAPTVLRDSLFSGVYYMSYTKLKSCYSASTVSQRQNYGQETVRPNHSVNFMCGILSGLIASVITNPLDVMKTTVQVDNVRNKSMRHTIYMWSNERHGYMRMFDGLVPRSLRRTLLAATTWTIYEYLADSLR